ncbi:hypothetical protein C0991_001152 [Blastosporella zonata]|nr:hypothetical protein C0991_001152 [Blastosporella zonata]
MRPIDLGADIVVESMTKWIDGHGVALGGVMIDSGNFDWKGSDKYPGLTKSSLGHHTFVYADVFGPTAFATKLRADILRDLGPTLDPFTAFFMLQGLETLSLRAERQCGNAFALARWLEKHIHVASVSYLGLETHTSHLLAKAYLKEGLYGAVLTFSVNEGSSAADTVMRNLSLASHSDSLGESKTSVFRLASRNKAKGNLTGQEMIRVSVGIEAIEDIIADFAVALDYLN